MGTPMEGRERVSSSPNSRGGSEHWLRLKDNLAGTESEDNLRDAAKGIECDMGGGSRGRPLGVCDLLWPCDGLVLAPHLCFALWSSKVPSCPHEHSRLLVLLRSPSWSLHHGECSQGHSESCRMSPFLDLSRSLSRFLSRSLSLDL